MRTGVDRGSEGGKNRYKRNPKPCNWTLVAREYTFLSSMYDICIRYAAYAETFYKVRGLGMYIFTFKTEFKDKNSSCFILQSYELQPSIDWPGCLASHSLTWCGSIPLRKSPHATSLTVCLSYLSVKAWSHGTTTSVAEVPGWKALHQSWWQQWWRT